MYLTVNFQNRKNIIIKSDMVHNKNVSHRSIIVFCHVKIEIQNNIVKKQVTLHTEERIFKIKLTKK